MALTDAQKIKLIKLEQLAQYDTKIKAVISAGDTTVQGNVTALSGIVDSTNLIVATGKDTTVPNAIAKAVADEATRATTVEGTLQTNITAEETARKAQIGTLGKDSGGTNDYTVKGYVDDQVTTINTAATKLGNVVGYTELAISGQDSKTVKARLEVLEGGNTTEGSVAKALKDAKDYTDGKDTAMDARVDALEATHATKTVGNNVSFKTVAEEVSEGVAAVVDDADAAFDTLKEIAQWIQKEGTTGFDAAARIVALEGYVDGTNLTVATNATVNVPNAISYAVGVEETRATAAEGTLTSNLTAEVSRATAAETAISDDLGAASVANTAPQGQPSNAKAATGLHLAVETNAKDIADLKSAVGTSSGGHGNTLGDRVAALEAEDRVNVINSITVNGTAISPDTDKNVAITDVASASSLTSLTTYVGTASVANTAPQGQPSNAKEATGLTALVETNAKDIDTVDGRVDSVVARLDGLDAEKSGSDTNSNITVTVTQTDGAVASVAVSATYATESDINGLFA